VRYRCGIDTGGTFTDCVIIDEVGRITIAKSPSTPSDYSKGLFSALEACAEKIGITLEELVKDTEFLFHGTTVGTNALVEMKGAKTGFITTRGHRDNLLIMRSAGRSAGLPIEKLLRVSRHQKPDPIIPRRLICEVSERVDWKGDVFLPLNQTEAEEAIHFLVDEGVESIGICFLWAVVNPEHEKIVKEMVQQIAPNVYVCCSHELIAKTGEYERAVSTAINCFIGPTTKKYVEKVENGLKAQGYGKTSLVLQATGGVVPSNEAIQTPLFTISSGPAGGITASNYLGRVMGHENIIITDMGGTSFEVGLIHNGNPLTASETIINQYVFLMPRLDIESIGNGGGSVIWIDESSKTLKVGPESAGADPGPACYGKGDRPTVTDADLILGYLSPDNFLGGKIRLNKNRSMEALKAVAKRMGMDVHQVAAGAVRIAESQMAELIRQMTVQRGLDPREFIIFAYGGAGPMHACQYARELGVGRVVIPLGTISSTWSAFGTLCADVLHVYEKSELLAEPFDVRRMNEIFTELEGQGDRQLADDGIKPEKRKFQRFVEMKYKMQIHQIVVPVPSGELAETDVKHVTDRFEKIYEGLYGKGAAYREAGIEIGLFRVNALGDMKKPDIPDPGPAEGNSLAGYRKVFWPELAEFIDTPIYIGPKLGKGEVINGPCVVEYPETTVVVHSFARGILDPVGNFVLDLEGESV